MSATVKIFVGAEPWTADAWYERPDPVAGALVTTAAALESRAAIHRKKELQTRHRHIRSVEAEYEGLI